MKGQEPHGLRSLGALWALVVLAVCVTGLPSQARWALLASAWTGTRCRDPVTPEGVLGRGSVGSWEGWFSGAR